MTSAGRALLGAMLGAVISLLAHPTSRPYLFSAFISPSKRNAAPQASLPNSLVELSDWMTAVGDRYSVHRSLSASELQNAVAAAVKASKMDPDNAFWHQMLASLFHQLGDQAQAKRHWTAAAACATWNDYQSDELLRERERLATEFGGSQSWQLAYVYYQRNSNAVQLIFQYSGSILANTSLSDREGLKMRALCVINGGKLSAGSRNIAVGNIGVKMAEQACHPAGLNAQLTSHKLFLARIELHDKLRAIGEMTLADEVNHVYRESDAWNAMEDPEDADNEAWRRAFESLVLVGLPSSMLVVGSTGLVAWLLGLALSRYDRVHWAAALAAGCLLGWAVYAITLLPLAAITTLLCCAVLMLGPKRERRGSGAYLGPMFSFSAGTLAFVFSLLVTAFVLGLTAPAVSLLPALDIPHEYFGGSSVFLGLATIVLAILLLMAPMFAIALRIGTGFMLSRAMRYFGAFLAYVALAGIVVGTPLCIYGDRRNEDTMKRIVTNEPVYYLALPR